MPQANAQLNVAIHCLTAPSRPSGVLLCSEGERIRVLCSSLPASLMLAPSAKQAVHGMRNFQFRPSQPSARSAVRFAVFRATTPVAEHQRYQADLGSARARSAIHRASRSLLAVTLLVLGSACAHEPTASPSIPQKEPHDMTSTEPFRSNSPAEYPELTPREVGNRVLRLLDGLKTTDGLTLDEVAAKTGLPLKYEPRGRAHALIIKQQDSPWFYSVVYRGAKPPIAVELNYAYDGDAPPPGEPPCGLELDVVAKRLKDDGFMMRIDEDGIGQPLAYIFRRDRVDVMVFVAPDAPGERSAAPSLCIGQLMITSAD